MEIETLIWGWSQFNKYHDYEGKAIQKTWTFAGN